MNRQQERRARRVLRQATTDSLSSVVAWHAPHNHPEPIMDELWVQKAALGELLRRGEFDDRS